MNDLLPNYLKRRQADLVQIAGALESGDFSIISMIGHKLSGNAATFGFAPLGELGQKLEAAAARKNVIEIKGVRDQIIEFLEQIDLKPKSR